MNSIFLCLVTIIIEYFHRKVNKNVEYFHLLKWTKKRKEEIWN